MLRSPQMTDLRQAIEACGGLFTRSGLADRWGVSKAYVSEVTAREDFPKHFEIDAGKPVWAGQDADDWRATPRKPGPKS
jgi:hypothetical protein